jgi:endoglucanase
MVLIPRKNRIIPPVAGLKPPAPPQGVFSVGINLSGAQGTFPFFASTACVNYYAGKLIKHFRIPFCWSLPNSVAPYTGFVGAQPAAFGPIDTTSTTAFPNGGYVGMIDQIILAAAAAGCKCLIDNHMFGVGPGNFNVGSAQLPVTAFADLWGKLAAHYVANPSLLAGIYGLDLMNEWPNGFDSAIIFSATQLAINSIRAAGYTGRIYVEGTNYTSAWNWVSGQGNPFNSSGLYALNDSQNNLVFSAHMYPDWDDSGSHFGYADQVATPGAAPPGINTNPTIGVTRISREYVPWLNQHGLVGHLGEYGSSNDSPWFLGLFDYADWNLVTRNLLTYLQANRIEFSIWSGGPGFATGYGPNGYGYSLDPGNVNMSGLADFTSTGVQHPTMIVLDDFTGYSGPQPTAYALFRPGSPPSAYYLTNGVASGNFIVYYGGRISSPITITPHDFLVDGVTSAGGTFTPASVPLAAGENGLATFTYTPSQTATILISTTNSAGWIDPPTLNMSSIVDGYSTLPIANLTNIYGLYNRFTPNTGPAIRLQRVSDGQQMDWGFTRAGAGSYYGLDRAAIQTWASARSGIPVVTLYGIGPGQQNSITFTGTLPTLNLNNSAGYPEIVAPVGIKGVFNIPINNKTAFSTIIRMNQSSSAAYGIYSMNWFNGPILPSIFGIQLFSTGSVTPPAQGAINQFLSWAPVNGAYHDYGATYSSGVANGFITYKDSTVIATATVTYTLGTFFGSSQAEFGWDKNFGLWWVGSFTNAEIEPGLSLTAAQNNNIMGIDATYYSTPLPDTLPAVPPTITNILSNMPIYPSIVPARPFGAVSITDGNSGSPTETITITLTGAAGTLSGTGLSGTGPYTAGPDTPANITTILNQASFSTSAGVGSTTTFTLLVTSSAGSSSSNGATSTVVSTFSQAALTPPAGTFTPVNHSGYNFAGGELNPSFGLGPAPAQIDALAANGFGLMRYVINNQWLYTAEYGALNASMLAAMKTVIDYAFTKNIYVVIDPHNSGNQWDPVFSTSKKILASTRESDLFQDFWRRVASAFVNYPNVIFGLMNEPTQAATVWRDWGCTPAITAIRAVGATQLILIPGTGQSSALGWSSNGNTAAFAGYAADTANNFAFEAHQYLDASASGGGSVATLNGSTILNTFNSFLTTNSFKGFIGEFGMAPDPFKCNGTDTLHYLVGGTNVTTNSITANSNMLSAMVSSGLYKGWAAWGGGYEFATPPTNNGYVFNPEPSRTGFNYNTPLYQNVQQLSALQTYLI